MYFRGIMESSVEVLKKSGIENSLGRLQVNSGSQFC